MFHLISTDIVTDSTYPMLDVDEPLIPHEMILLEYISSSPDEAFKKYKKYLKSEDYCRLSILGLIMDLDSNKLPILITGDEEMEVGFPQDLLKIIRKRYNVDIKILKSEKDTKHVIKSLESDLTKSFDKVKYLEDLNEDKDTLIFKRPEDLIDFLEEKSKKELVKLLKPHLSKKEKKDIITEDYSKKKLIKLYLKKLKED